MATLTHIGLTKSEEVASTSTATATYTPVNGAIVWVDSFCAEAPYTTNSVVHLKWDTEVIWSIKGGGPMPDLNLSRTGDGTKQWVLTLDNSDTVSIFMSGHARLRVIT